MPWRKPKKNKTRSNFERSWSKRCKQKDLKAKSNPQGCPCNPHKLNDRGIGGGHLRWSRGTAWLGVGDQGMPFSAADNYPLAGPLGSQSICALKSKSQELSWQHGRAPFLGGNVNQTPLSLGFWGGLALSHINRLHAFSSRVLLLEEWAFPWGKMQETGAKATPRRWATNRKRLNAWTEDHMGEQTTGAILQGPTWNQGTKGRLSTEGRWAPSSWFTWGMPTPNGGGSARSPLVFPVAGGMSLEEARLGPVFCLPRTRHTLMLTTTDTNRYASSVRADSETGKGCVSYSDVL